MDRIRVPVQAYKLHLYPQLTGSTSADSRLPARGQRMQALENGLAMPSFWTTAEINRAFTNANSIWVREAEIEFHPVTISERSVSVPDDEHRMWVYFLNHLRPSGRGVSVAFVNDLPSHEGGWGGGHVAIVSGRSVSQGLQGFAGALLAHELGHVLTGSPGHVDDPSNLMYARIHPRRAIAGLLNRSQVTICRERAQTM